MKTITVTDEVYMSIENLIKKDDLDISCISDLIGKAFFFRTVTYHLVGRVKKILSGNFLVLEDASWVADSGRFTQAIKGGTLSEVEPVGDAIINLSTVTDMFPWRHDLPKDQK